MGYRVLSEGERDKYPLVCADEVAVRMEELLRERGAAPLLTLATAETREEALKIMREITAERRERRSVERRRAEEAERDERRAGETRSCKQNTPRQF
jgi:hypothetical protein